MIGDFISQDLTGAFHNPTNCRVRKTEKQDFLPCIELLKDATARLQKRDCCLARTWATDNEHVAIFVKDPLALLTERKIIFRIGRTHSPSGEPSSTPSSSSGARLSGNASLMVSSASTTISGRSSGSQSSTSRPAYPEPLRTFNTRFAS